MSYYLYQLTFDSLVHFGQAELGGHLEQITLDYPSDTLFSALCCELARQGGNEVVEDFYSKTASGQIALSDLYPYMIHDNGECHFYVPKPVLGGIKTPNKEWREYEQACRDSRQKKAVKKLPYVRAIHLNHYLSALQHGTPFTEKPKFGEFVLVQKVNCRNEKPYYVGCYTFHPRAGLYGIIKAEEADRDWLQRIFTLLGYSGIGGKRSSGYGKFHLYDDFIEMDEQGIYEDDGELYRRLVDNEAAWQMAISMVLPEQEDIPAVARESWYTLRKRSGFIDAAGEVRKRDSLYMIASGSCFSKRIDGSIAVLPGNEHPVYRYGKGMYLGLI